MAERKEAKKLKDNLPPASSPEARENQMISLAIDLAEKQLKDGTASASVITHYLKLASSREKLEQEMLNYKIGLVSAQTEAIESSKHVEQLYQEAINAMRVYSGHDTEYEDEEFF